MARKKIRLKTSDDIQKLRIGGKRLARIIRIVGEHVKPGVNTKELDTIFNKLVVEGGDVPVLLGYKPYGADYPYPASVCISVNDEVVHGIPDETLVLRDGDIVKIDGCLSHDGMIVDHAISVPCGNITDIEKKLLEDTKLARAAGIRAAQHGNYISDISKAIEKEVSGKYGIVKILSGHGVGYAVHEEPYVPNYDDGTRGVKLEEGLVIAIEPMLNLGTDDCEICADGYTFVTSDEKKSAHFEHTVLITKNGPEILTVE
jgi:methionyl aminopeptidase